MHRARTLTTAQMQAIAREFNLSETAFTMSPTTSRASEERVRAAGVDVVRPPGDEAFGRQLQPAAPGGMLVKVNELEPELFA